MSNMDASLRKPGQEPMLMVTAHADPFKYQRFFVGRGLCSRRLSQLGYDTAAGAEPLPYGVSIMSYPIRCDQ